MPPVLRSSRRLLDASTSIRRSSKRCLLLTSKSWKNRSKIPRRKRSFVDPIFEDPNQLSLQELVSASSSSSTFQLDFAAPSWIFPLKVKKKPRSSRLRPSRKVLPEINYGRVTEVANSGTSLVEEVSFGVSVSFRRDGSNDELRSEKFMRSSGKDPTSEIKSCNSDGSYSMICEGSNSFMPAASERPVQQYSPEDQVGIEKKDFPVIEELEKGENAAHEGFELPSKAKDPPSSISGSTVQLKGEELRYDRACSEQLSCSDQKIQGHDWNYTNLFERNEFSDSSLTSFSDLLPDVFEDSSGNEFSEGRGETFHSSPCFLLFLQYKKELLKSDCDVETSDLFLTEMKHADDFRTFDDNDEEETYRRFRCSERRNLFRRDYVDELGPTEFGEIIYKQRVSAVGWIVEHCSSCKLQWETTFLSVSLLDRFLCRGFFTSESYLQILGIACATLATRIEENQLYNCIRQEEFQINQRVYRKCEVVAMEWVILDVLSYQCFSITTINFLRFYLKLVNADEGLENYTQCLALLSLAHHELLYFWPSTIAAGLVIQACLAKGAKDPAAIRRVRETHIRTREDDDELKYCIKLIENMDEG